MKRWGLWIVLLLSLGLNFGLILGRSLPLGPIGGEPASADGPQDPAPQEATGPESTRPGAAVEGPLPPRLERRLGQMVGRMAADLGLEGETRQTFHELQMGFFEASIAARQRGRRLQGELRRELISTAPDRERAETLLAQVAEATADQERAFVGCYFDSMALLDAAQQIRYRDFLGRLRRFRTELERRRERQLLRERAREERGAGATERRPGPRRPWRQGGDPPEPDPADSTGGR